MVRLTDSPDMTLDVYRGRKTTIQQRQQILVRHPMVFILLNLFDLLEFLVMLMTLILVIGF